MHTKKIIILRKKLDEIELEKKKISDEILLLEKLNQQQKGRSDYLGIKALNKTPETPFDKIKLFLELFTCRKSVFPKLWVNQNKNTKGYSPACNNE